ncbi:hypothetical protein Aperf_G00000112842 [Anoplocephala perfoliata]
MSRLCLNLQPENKAERCRQLEKTVRDQEKIITLLEKQLNRKRLQENRIRTPLRGRIGHQNSLGNRSTPSLRHDSAHGSSISSPDMSRLDQSLPLQSASPPLPSMSTGSGSSIPALARRVRSLVRDIREDTEASIVRNKLQKRNLSSSRERH